MNWTMGPTWSLLTVFTIVVTRVTGTPSHPIAPKVQSRTAPASSGAYAGTFTLGPGGLSNDPDENSFYLALIENDTAATSAAIPAGTNPNNFVALDRPVVGSPWRVYLDLRSHPGVAFTAVVLSDRRVSTPSRYGELVVDLSSTLLPASIAARVKCFAGRRRPS